MKRMGGSSDIAADRDKGVMKLGLKKMPTVPEETQDRKHKSPTSTTAQSMPGQSSNTIQTLLPDTGQRLVQQH